MISSFSIPPERAFFAYGALLNFVAAVLMLAIVFTKGRRSERTWVFMAFTGSAAWWNLFYFLWLASDSFSSVNLYCRLLALTISISPLALFHFGAILTKTRDKYRRWLPGFYVTAIILGLVGSSHLTIAGFRPIMQFPFWPIPGPAFHLQTVLCAVYVTLYFRDLFQALKTATGLHKEQVRFILISSLFTIPGSLMNYLPWYGIKIPPYGNAFLFIQMACFAYAVLRYRIIDLNLVTRNALVYALFGLTYVGPWLMGIWLTSSAAVTALLVTAAILLTPVFFHKVRDVLEQAIDRLPAFKERYERFKTMKQVLERLEDVRTVGEWAACIVESVRKIYQARTVNVLIWDAEQNGYLVKSGFGHSPAELTFLMLPEDSPVVVHCKTKRSVLMAEMVQADMETQDGIQADMDFLHAALSVPIFFDGRLQAILNVGELPDKRMFNDLDLAHLGNLARAAEHSLRVVLRGLRTVQTTAAWAHDLAKPLGVKGALGRLEDLAARETANLPASVAETLRLAVSDIAFLRKNLQKLIRPDGDLAGSVEPIVLAPLFERVKKRFLPMAEEKGIDWRVAPSEERNILCGEEGLEHRVLANLLENAFRHTPSAGSVRLSAKWDQDWCTIEVEDTGPGIAPEVQEKIFGAGVQGDGGGQSGLGLFIARQVTEQQGGTLTLQSSPGKGSVFSIRLRRG